MSEFILNLEIDGHDVGASDRPEERRNADDRAALDVAPAPPPVRRPRITSLQQWLDLCA